MKLGRSSRQFDARHLSKFGAMVVVVRGISLQGYATRHLLSTSTLKVQVRLLKGSLFTVAITVMRRLLATPQAPTDCGVT